MVNKHYEVINDLETALLIANKAIDQIVDEDRNISVIKTIDKDYIREFITNVALEKEGYEDYMIFGFYDDDELVGACLVSEGSPWYNPKLLIFNEEFTVAFKRGAGIARRISELLKYALSKGYCDFIQTGSVNEWCANMLKNTYTKEGFHIYNNYYLSKEDIK